MNTEHNDKVPPQNSPANKWEDQLAEFLRATRFGSIEIIVHEGRVVQVQKTERVRFQ